MMGQLTKRELDELERMAKEYSKKGVDAELKSR